VRSRPGNSGFRSLAAGLRWLPALLLLISLLARPTPAWACWCFQHDILAPRDAFAGADAVFMGTVTGIANYRQLPWFDWMVKVWPAASDRFSDIRVRFNVDRSWKSVATSDLTLRTGYICGYAFSSGTQYVVYAHNFEESLRVDFCTRTMPAGSAAEDFGFLNGLPPLPLTRAWPSPFVLGSGAAVGGLLAFAVLWRARHSQSGRSRIGPEQMLP
jgi:hypothetical protein